MQIFCNFFSIFLLKCRLGGFVGGTGAASASARGWVSAVGGVFSHFDTDGGGRFLVVRSLFDTPTAGAFSLASLLLRSWLPLGFGGNPRPKHRPPHHGREGLFCGVFRAFFCAVWNCPPFRRLPPKRRVFGVFRGVALPVCYLYKKMIDCGGGWNREGLIFFCIGFSKHKNAPLKGVFCVLKIFYIFLKFCVLATVYKSIICGVFTRTNPPLSLAPTPPYF